MNPSEQDRIEESQIAAFQLLQQRDLGGECAKLLETIQSAYPKTEESQRKENYLKQYALSQLLSMPKRNLTDEWLVLAVKWALAANDQQFFKILGEVLESPEPDPQHNRNELDWFLVLNWLERTPLRLRDNKLVVSLRRPPKGISAAKSTPGLCQFTQGAIAQYYALVEQDKRDSAIMRYGDAYKGQLEKRCQRFNLVTAEKNLVRGVKVERRRVNLTTIPKAM